MAAHTDTDAPPSLLNIFEVQVEERVRHLVCLLEPDRAQAEGIAARRIVGEFTPNASGEFDPDSFLPNGDFIRAYVEYMHQEVVRTPELMLLAQEKPGEALTLVDPRHPEDFEGDVPTVNVVGRFQVDAEGWIEPGSFRYNAGHRWFDRTFGVSGVLENPELHAWLNAEPTPRPGA
jgi:hypothetical protein